jgi:hypothetical protein
VLSRVLLVLGATNKDKTRSEDACRIMILATRRYDPDHNRSERDSVRGGSPNRR